MSFNYSPKVIKDGLQLYLDAANPKSYPGTGLSWFDLSGNNRTFTLNATGISWNSSGYFTLADNGATYDGATSTSTTSTCVFWLKTTDVQSLFWGGNDGGFYLGAYRVDNKEYYGSCGTPDFYMDTIDYGNIYDNIRDDKWHMLEFKNVNLSNWTSSKFNTYNTYTFGNGACASIMIYNRNLTADESRQNYNTMKSRFNLI